MEFIDNYELMPLISDLSFENDGIMWSSPYHLNDTPITICEMSPYKKTIPTKNINQPFFNEQNSNIAGYLAAIQTMIIIAPNPIAPEINQFFYYLSMLEATNLARHAQQPQHHILEEIILNPMQKAYANTLAIEPFMQGLQLLQESYDISENNNILDLGKELAKTLGNISYQAFNYHGATTQHETDKIYNKLQMIISTLPIKLMMSLLYSQYENINAPYKISTASKHLLTNSAIFLTASTFDWPNSDSIPLLLKQFLIDKIAFSSFVKGIAPKDHAFPYFIAGAINAALANTLYSIFAFS